jgi:hypothetical protein
MSTKAYSKTLAASHQRIETQVRLHGLFTVPDKRHQLPGGGVLGPAHVDPQGL